VSSVGFEAFEAEDIKSRLGNTDAYARLWRLWNEKIAVSGPPPDTRIGSFSLSAAMPSKWEVFALAPKIDDAHFFVRSIINKADDDHYPLTLFPAMIIAMDQPKLYWIDVVNGGAVFFRAELLQRCAKFVARVERAQAWSVGR